MLVSHRSRFIYTKTIKTAGTSVETYFEPHCMESGEWEESHYRQEYCSQSGIVGFRGLKLPDTCTWWSHMSAREIREKLGEDIWSSYYKFCVIRNPFEKALSTFYWRKHRATIQVDDNLNDQLQFENWLVTQGPPIDRETYLIDGEFCLDNVIRYEVLQTDMERVCCHLGLPWTPSALKRYKSGIRPDNTKPGQMYSDKAKQIVLSAYQFEFEYFGYSQEPGF